MFFRNNSRRKDSDSLKRMGSSQRNLIFNSPRTGPETSSQPLSPDMVRTQMQIAAGSQSLSQSQLTNKNPPPPYHAIRRAVSNNVSASSRSLSWSRKKHDEHLEIPISIRFLDDSDPLLLTIDVCYVM